MKTSTLKNLIIFITGFVVLAAVAIQQYLATASSENIKHQPDQTIVINTTNPGADYIGYAGKVPLEIYLQDGKIQKIVALPNNETTSFFDNASTILSAWDGMTPEEALSSKVDAVSGATYSSRAIINNVQAGLQVYQKETQRHSFNIQPISSGQSPWTLQNICALVVLLAAMILPLWIKNKWYRIAQLILNVAVLGLWSCTFINYTLLVSAFSYGLDPLVSFLPLLMIIAAFIYPLVGKKQYYCTNICPLGSAQELCGKIPAPKLRIGPTLAKGLTWTREIIWAILMVLLAFGVWAEWMDYEPFAAFAIEAASIGILIFAAVILVISIFVPRAYCRFVCPTGTFLKSVPQIRKKPSGNNSARA